MAEDKKTTESKSVEERDYSSMSDKELYELIAEEGAKFVEQTENGDINPLDYYQSEQFTFQRLINLFFAFEYFMRTNHGSQGVYGKELEKHPEWMTLYAMTLDVLRDGSGMELYGDEYILQ
jgi:hypothetical protein